MKNIPITKKLQNYFTNPKYYLKTTFQPFSENIKILLSILFVLSLVWGGTKTLQDIPAAIAYSNLVADDFLNHYPEDLVFTWNQNKLQYNFSHINEADLSPLSIPFSTTMPELPATFPNNFAFITNTVDSPSNLEISPVEYLFFINANSIYTATDIVNTTWESRPLSDFFGEISKTTVTKDDVVTAVQTVQNTISQNQFFIQLIYMLILIPIFIVNKVLILAVESVFVLLLFRIYSMNLSAKQTLSLCISVFIPTTIIATVAELLYTDVSIPLNTLGFWIVLLFVLYSLKNTALVQVRKIKNN